MRINGGLVQRQERWVGRSITEAKVVGKIFTMGKADRMKHLLVAGGMPSGIVSAGLRSESEGDSTKLGPWIQIQLLTVNAEITINGLQKKSTVFLVLLKTFKETRMA